MAVFVVLCEGFLGISLHFDLWWYFFAVALQKKREKSNKQELHMPMGCVGIHLQNNRVGEYPSMQLSTFNRGWHLHWFYLKNDTAVPLPEFSGRLIEEAPDSWKWGVLEKDKKKIRDHLTAIRILKERGLKGSGIIGAYHARRVVPLMRCALPLYAMAPRVSFDGTSLIEGRSPPPKWRSTARRR